jgi:transposase
MELLGMYQKGMSQSEIARQLGMDRKTVRKYLHQPPQGYGPRPPPPWKLNPYRSYLRERWEQGVHNRLPAAYLKDSADRIIAATALTEGLPLITADRQIQRSKALPTI